MRPRVTTTAPKHGTRATYINWRCRCEACKQANAKYTAKWRKEKDSRGTGD